MKLKGIKLRKGNKIIIEKSASSLTTTHSFTMVEERKQPRSTDDLEAGTALIQLLGLGNFVSKLLLTFSAAGEISTTITTPIRFTFRDSAAQDLVRTSAQVLLRAVERGAEDPNAIIPLMVGLCTLEAWVNFRGPASAIQTLRYESARWCRL